MAEHFVGTVREIPEKKVVLLQLGETSVGVFKVNGAFHAWENRCAHVGGPVCQGEVLGRFEHLLDSAMAVVGERFSEDEFHLVCPWHGWEYNVETGVCTTDAKFKLRRYQTVVRGDQVYMVD